MNPATGERRSLRWCPTAEQIAVLEGLFSGGLRNPSTSQIHQIVDQLSQYGKVQGRNVFYWFQNHKAREKQKIRQQLSRQYKEHTKSYYDYSSKYTVMVSDGCLLPQQPDGISSCIPSNTSYLNVSFDQGEAPVMCACHEPVTTNYGTMLEVINPARDPPYHHPLGISTLDLFPATPSSLSSLMHINADTHP